MFFFEYAGSNISHYLFSQAVDNDTKEIILKDINTFSSSNRIFLIADSDNSKKSTKKGKRLIKLEEYKKENFFPKIIWDVREIENLLTDEIWKEVLIELCDKGIVKKHEEEVKSRISNAVAEIKSIDFEKEYIGSYLNQIREYMSKIEGKYILNSSSYMNNGDTFGTLTNKRFLSEIVFQKQFDWEIFSKSEKVKTLTEEIYSFIKKS